VFRRARKGPACLRRGREVGGGAESATTSDAETRYRTVLQVCLLVSGALTSSLSRTHSLFCPVHLRGSLDADGLATWGALPHPDTSRAVPPPGRAWPNPVASVSVGHGKGDESGQREKRRREGKIKGERRTLGWHTSRAGPCERVGDRCTHARARQRRTRLPHTRTSQREGVRVASGTWAPPLPPAQRTGGAHVPRCCTALPGRGRAPKPRRKEKSSPPLLAPLHGTAHSGAGRLGVRERSTRLLASLPARRDGGMPSSPLVAVSSRRSFR
jgi:hypothetical protein